MATAVNGLNGMETVFMNLSRFKKFFLNKQMRAVCNHHNQKIQINFRRSILNKVAIQFIPDIPPGVLIEKQTQIAMGAN